MGRLGAESGDPGRRSIAYGIHGGRERTRRSQRPVSERILGAWAGLRRARRKCTKFGENEAHLRHRPQNQAGGSTASRFGSSGIPKEAGDRRVRHPDTTPAQWRDYAGALWNFTKVGVIEGNFWCIWHQNQADWARCPSIGPLRNLEKSRRSP